MFSRLQSMESVIATVNLGVGCVGLAAGIWTYSRLSSSANIPMQIQWNGSVGWSMASRHAFLLYPILSAGMGLLPIALIRYPTALKINYPFTFEASQLKKQRSLAVLYSGAVMLSTGVFLCLLSGLWIPKISISQRATSIPGWAVKSLNATEVLLSCSYFYEAWNAR